MLERYRYRLPKDFDPNVYLLINEDIKASGADPFRHYAKHGKSEGRQYRLRDLVPEDFSPEAYLLLNKDVAESSSIPEIHYHRFGKWERRLYKFTSSKDKVSEFDEKWYLEEYPDILSYRMPPYEHFTKFGRYEGRHPRFDAGWYQNEYNQILKYSSLEPFEHYRQVGRQELLHPAFDAFWYALIYPDVAKSGLDAIDHYNECGRREGRHPAFHRQWYRKEYLSAGQEVDSFRHYMNIGRSEGNHPAFHHEWYVNEYHDIKMTDLLPFEHFERYGRTNGYLPAPTVSPASYTLRLTDFPAPFDSEYQAQNSFENHSTDIKAIAFYLPQFHEIEENNRWWGEGFTEWSNTRAATPLFDGHYQPRQPHADIGYYDLSNPDSIRLQAALARQHGIHGFCFYHYWFSGQRLLERPLDNLLKNKDIDLNFMICWANENWTRTWDGSDQEKLIEQKYHDSDPLDFIRDAEVYLTDARYICLDGSPVLLVYKPHVIPNVGDVFAEWRRYWSARHKRPLQIWCVRTDPSDHSFVKLNAKIDGIVEFPPHVIPHSNHLPRYTLSPKLAKINATGNFYDYRALADDMIAGRDYSPKPLLPLYRGAMLGWDNSARRKKGQSIWYGFDLKSYYLWLSSIIERTRSEFPRDRRFVFINAWNEWAEGTYLEPDVATGYAALNTTSKALYGIDYEALPVVLDGDREQDVVNDLKVLIHIHVYHLDLVPEFISRLDGLTFKYDVIVTTDSRAKVQALQSVLGSKLPGVPCKVVLAKNLGRDIGPMLLNIREDIARYDVFGHFHTKKSPTVAWGDHWRTYLLDNLIGSPANTSRLLRMFRDDPRLGLLKAPTFPLIAPHVSWGDVRQRCADLLAKMELPNVLSSSPHFPVGNMFWARVDAIKPVLDYPWRDADFEIEADQVAGTLPHCIERLWDYVSLAKNYDVREVLSIGQGESRILQLPKTKSVCLFVHYSAADKIEDADLELLRRLKEQVDDIFVVSNSNLDASCRARAALYAREILVRPNVGLDFAAWRDLIKYVGWQQIESYDEVFFVNNSCYGPVFDFEGLFGTMRASNVDFWGVTAFPRLENSNRPEAVYLPEQTIPRHIQSYFIAFRNKVVRSRQFYRFWDEIENKDNFMSVVASYEVRLTETLEKAGFTWDVYVPGAEHLQWEHRSDARYNAPYNSSYDLVLLKCPLIKKRAWDYDQDKMMAARKLVGQIGYYPAYLMER